MTFRPIDRNLIKMIFVRDIVSEMSGTYMDGRHERRWEIIRRKKNLFRDNESYDVGLSGCYEWESADTVDEALDMLEAMIQEVAA